MWRALLTTLTVGWELYAIVAVSDTGVGFLDVALAVPTACLLAIAWALPWSAPARGRAWLLGLWASFAVLGAALVVIYLSSQSPFNPLFRARYATVMSPDEVRFLTAECGVVDQCGLAYRPHSRPAGARYVHIAGPWYLIYEPF